MNTIIEEIRALVERQLKNTHDWLNGKGAKKGSPRYYKMRGRESAFDFVLSILSDLEKEEKPDEQWNEDDNAGLTQILEDVLGNSAICRYCICTPAQVAAYMKTMVKAIKLMKHFNL